MRDSNSLIGSPFFVFFSGSAAVFFFFTLSGFVLCWSYFNHEDPKKLLLAFLKRLPRLAVIVTITTLVSYALFKTGLYHFQEASKLTSSTWLASFAKSSGWTPEFQPSFLEALFQGLTTFFTGESGYNSSLWTMRPEYFGSIMVFMLACFISIVLEYRYLAYAFIVISVSSLFCNEYIFPFVVGTFLSAYLAKNKIEVSYLVSLILVVIGLYMLGYMIPIKAYAWSSIITEDYEGLFRLSLHSFASALIIFATMVNRRLFNNLNGKFCKFLGRISFPLYLVHVLVICSLSSHAYLWVKASGASTQLTFISVFILTTFVSVTLAMLLSWFDDWWVSRVNSVARKLISRQVSRPNCN